MHLVQPVGDLLERLAQPLVECRLQLLVDGRPHLIQLLRVLAAQDVEPLLDGRTHRFEALLVRSRELGEPVAELHARSLGGGRLFTTGVREILPQIPLEIRRGLPQHFEPRANVRGLARRGIARTRRRSHSGEHGNHQHGDDGERDNDEQSHGVGHGAPSLLRSTRGSSRAWARVAGAPSDIVSAGAIGQAASRLAEGRKRSLSRR